MTTDPFGRFRISGAGADHLAVLRPHRSGMAQGERTFLVGEPCSGVRQVKSGTTLDLGEVRVKAGPEVRKFGSMRMFPD